MQGWQTSYPGLRDMPSEISEFELQTFFSFSRAELDLIARRRSDALKLGLALHIGFARMTGRPLNSVRIVPPALLRHLGRELDIAAPDLVSLRALHARGRTLFDDQHQACECLGIKWMTEHQRRALVRVLRDEVAGAGAATTVTKCRQNKRRRLKSAPEWRAFGGYSRGNRKLCIDKHLRAQPASNPRQSWAL